MIVVDDPDPGGRLQRFVADVRRRGGIDSESEATMLARATLRHLGQQISADRASVLATALPAELAAEVTTEPRAQTTEFDEDTFLDQVAAHVHVDDRAEVGRRVRAVLATVRSWAPDEQVEKTLAALPPDLAVLFA